MAESNDAGFPCKYYTHSTDAEGVSLNLKWTVKNFHKLLVSTHYKFPPIRPTPQCDLEVSFYKDHTYVNDLCIFVENMFKSEIRYNAITIICDENGKQLFQGTKNNLLLKGRHVIVDTLKNRFVLPDSLVIEIKLDLYNLTSEKCDTASLENEIKLLEDMKNFILADHPEEIVLKTKDTEIPANKAILRARSPVFQRMFDHPMSEQEKNIVHVDDVAGTTLRTLIDFLYSGKVDISKSDLQSLKELYYVADKYQVLDLRKMCAQTMLSVLKKEHALELLVLAHQHSDQFLKDKCLYFIRTCIEALMGTEGWMNLKVSDLGLVVEVLETCCKGSAALQQKSE